MIFMWTLEGSREKIMAAISLHPNEKEVRIRAKPGKKIFLRLLQSTKVSRIYASEGIAKTISEKVKEALHSAGVQLVVIKKRAGRPEKFGMELKGKAVSMLSEGKTAKEISKALGVPATSVYFWKKQAKAGGKPRQRAEFVDTT